MLQIVRKSRFVYSSLLINSSIGPGHRRKTSQCPSTEDLVPSPTSASSLCLAGCICVYLCLMRQLSICPQFSLEFPHSSCPGLYVPFLFGFSTFSVLYLRLNRRRNIRDPQNVRQRDLCNRKILVAPPLLSPRLMVIMKLMSSPTT